MNTRTLLELAVSVEILVWVPGYRYTVENLDDFMGVFAASCIQVAPPGYLMGKQLFDDIHGLGGSAYTGT